MPFLSWDETLLYYETHGAGEPVIFLNGIMMSTIGWAAFIPPLSKKFNLILVDFRDQGRSSQMREPYDQDLHVGDLIRLFDHLNLSRAHVMGVSYGGQVALRLAILHPNRIKSLCLLNTPGRITSRLLEIGKAWEAAAELGDGAKFFQLALPHIYSEPFYEEHAEFLRERKAAFQAMLTREWFDGFIRLSRSAEHFSVSKRQLQNIEAPTLVVGSGRDSVVSDEALDYVRENIPGCEYIVIPNAGHAAFLEKMGEFLTIITGFVSKSS